MHRAAVEGDLAGVRRGFPPFAPVTVGPRLMIAVDALQRGLLVGKVPRTSTALRKRALTALDRVGRTDHPPNLCAERQDRHELGPGVVLQPHDRRMPGALEPQQTRPITIMWLRDRGSPEHHISRSHIAAARQSCSGVHRQSPDWHDTTHEGSPAGKATCIRPVQQIRTITAGHGKRRNYAAGPAAEALLCEAVSGLG